jgi:hypothetical protein
MEFQRDRQSCSPPSALRALAASALPPKPWFSARKAAGELLSGVNTTGTSFDGNEPIYNRIVEFERGGTQVVPASRKNGRSRRTASPIPSTCARA